MPLFLYFVRVLRAVYSLIPGVVPRPFDSLLESLGDMIKNCTVTRSLIWHNPWFASLQLSLPPQNIDRKYANDLGDNVIRFMSTVYGTAHILADHSSNSSKHYLLPRTIRHGIIETSLEDLTQRYTLPIRALTRSVGE